MWFSVNCKFGKKPAHVLERKKKKNTKNTGFGVKSALMTRKEEFSGRSFLFFNFFQRGVYSSLLKIMKTWTGHVSCFSIWFYRHVEYTNPPDSPDCGLVSHIPIITLSLAICINIQVQLQKKKWWQPPVFFVKFCSWEGFLLPTQSRYFKPSISWNPAVHKYQRELAFVCIFLLPCRRKNCLWFIGSLTLVEWKPEIGWTPLGCYPPKTQT